MLSFKTRSLQRCFLILLPVFFSCAPPSGKEVHTGWPSITRETKPWTRWWWQGSALTKEGITAEMEAYHDAGIGGLEITPIYGVYGEEDHFIDYLSPQWMELLMHVLKEAERLDMAIDMATGTGWPFGGPWVTNEDACKELEYKIFEVKGGSQLNGKIEFIQQPYLRMVGNQIYEVNENAEVEGRPLLGTRKEPALVMNTKNIKITDLVDPINKNKNLQALAIDQVKFQKPLQLKCLMAYGDNKQVIELTSSVDGQGHLNWTAPPGTWKLYALFEGFHGKMVERAGPGGEGNVIDHFSKTALKNYLRHFDEAFKNHDISPLRAFFNDSYEVDDARGAADFTPALFDEFEKRRGYDLRTELPALFGRDDTEKNQRVLCDYRETISGLLLDNFTTEWKAWAHGHGAMVRNQAHGSPSNILDLYAVVDIPEIEGTEPLRFKMATSSGNVTGKKLVSAEAATWLNEHFQSNLADIKEALDRFMLHGVNHLVYHGTCYSPPGDPWPGRLFYAAVHMNPRNPLWNDADALNAYVARCQSFLQRSLPDNDILLYFPIYDRFSTPGPEMIEHFDGIGKSFQGTGFAKSAELMLEKGYAFDYISDKQIREIKEENGLLKTSGNISYKTLVIPGCNYMPLETMERILSLAESGLKIIFTDQMPRSVSGYHDLEHKRTRFNEITRKLKTLTGEKSGSEKDNVQMGNDLESLLANAGIKREQMVDSGIKGIRKKNQDRGWVYFINNSNQKSYQGWISLTVPAEEIVMYDPMTGLFGRARTRKSGSGTEVYAILQPSQSLILETAGEGMHIGDFPYPEIASEPVALSGKWKVTFDSGGPALPPAFEADSLLYWTRLDDESYRAFSGTATYELSFSRPDLQPGRMLLQIDSVKESAEIFLNGKSIGTVIGPVYQVAFDGSGLQDQNILRIRVSNLMANRIAWLDRNNIFWKKFYNVNFPARRRENSKNNLFSAADWKPRSSGLEGKVVVYPLK